MEHKLKGNFLTCVSKLQLSNGFTLVEIVIVVMLIGIVEFYVTLDDDKEHCKRVLMRKNCSKGELGQITTQEAEETIDKYLRNLLDGYQDCKLTIPALNQITV